MANNYEIIKDNLDALKLTKAGYPYANTSLTLWNSMPRMLQGEENQHFYAMIDKLCSVFDTYSVYAWILSYQFNIETAIGYFLDNLGAFMGITRPPLANATTKKPVVIPQRDNKPIEEQIEWNELHGISGEKEGDVKNTYLAPDQLSMDEVADDETYKTYIKCLLLAQNNFTFSSIIDILSNVCTLPYYIMQDDPTLLKVVVHFDEDANMVLILREIASKISSRGFGIAIEQRLDTEDVKKKFGSECWEKRRDVV